MEKWLSEATKDYETAELQRLSSEVTSFTSSVEDYLVWTLDSPSEEYDRKLLLEEEEVLSEMDENWDLSDYEKIVSDIIWAVNLESWKPWNKQDEELSKKCVNLLEIGNSVEEITDYIQMVKAEPVNV